MRPVISNADESFVRSVQLTLDAHGIHHIDCVPHMGDNVFKYPNGVLVEDADYAAALALVEQLQRTHDRPALQHRGVRLMALLGLIAIGLVLLSIIRRA